MQQDEMPSTERPSTDLGAQEWLFKEYMLLSQVTLTITRGACMQAGRV